jgi:hypothetical protein
MNGLKPGSGGETPAVPETPPDDWSSHPGYEHVHMLSESDTDEFLKSHESVLVVFYAPCKFVMAQ